ncbi:MAG: tetratricopeptide repeat protein [Burkholderiales bacterium]|nr:tetratricopeptide repeat protein [Burkholderiales bacterium]
MLRRFLLSLTVLLVLALQFPIPAAAQQPQTDELGEAGRLLREGQLAEALAHVERRLAADPRDAQARFLKGVILTEQKRTDEAIAVFVRLTQDDPERAEPYNNLAVLYAAQGALERAREALESAVRVNPKYAIALENLGDVYARLAADAYARAAALSSRHAVREKLKLSRELAAGAGPRATSP